MKWSSQQARALDEVAKWLKNPTKPFFYLAGFAGTGKTTLAQHFAEGVNGLVLFAAYTGKAASVLKAKGCADARTLHSILYQVSDGDKTKLRKLEERLRKLLETPMGKKLEAIMERNDDIAELEEKLKDERDRSSGPRFSINNDSVLHEAELLILDECSMVDRRLARDVLQFKKPVLVLGDPAQLPPVKGAAYFTNREPDMLLTEIHRQAQGNPIIRAATAVRERRAIPFGEWEVDNMFFRKLRRDSADVKSIAAAAAGEGSQILTGKNVTRRKINRYVRKSLGFKGPYPQAGERLVCLRNDRELGVLNGVVCYASSDAYEWEDEPEGLTIRLDYDGHLIPGLLMERTPFDMYRDPSLEEHWSPNRYMFQADWGYALTVHKAQGSEWDHVLIIDDGMAKRNGTFRAQWLYTAITRASERLTIIA